MDYSTKRIINLSKDYIANFVIESDGSIKFDMTGSASKIGKYVEYLNLKVKICDILTEGRKMVLNFEVFDKPTNLHIYTDSSTFYLFSYVYNWIQGKNIHLIRNFSSNADYAKSLDDFKKFLIRRQYSLPLIDRFVQMNYYKDRDELLKFEKPHLIRKEIKGNDNTKYVAVFNSGSRPLVTKTINTVNTLCYFLDVTDITIKPVITQGSTIVNVMNKAKKNLESKVAPDLSVAK